MLPSGIAGLIISNEEKNDFLNIAQALQNSNVLLKGITKAIENKTKGQKRGFLGMTLDTLGTSLLGNMVTEKGILRVDYGNKDFQSKEGKGMLRAGYGNK